MPNAILWPPGYRAARGRPVELAWAAIVAQCAEPAIVSEKSAAPGWSFIRSRGNRRRKSDIQSTSAAVLDYDAAPPGTFDRVAAALKSHGWRAAMHSTFSYRADRESFRVVLPFAREVAPGEHSIVSKHVAGQLGPAVDPGSHDVAHRWAVPSHAPDAPYRHEAIDGRPIDVDAVLAAAPRVMVGTASGSDNGATRKKAPAVPTHATRRVDQILAVLPERFRRMIVDGPSVENSPLRRADDDGDGAWVPDRSAADFAAVAACVDCGCTDDEIVLLWSTFADGIGRRMAERGAWGERYLMQTITKVRTRLASRVRVTARVSAVFVRTNDGSVSSVRLAFSPCDPTAAASLALPEYVTVYANNADAWDSLFAAAALDTPDPGDVADTEAQSFALYGERLTLEIDTAPDRICPVRRILPAASEAAA